MMQTGTLRSSSVIRPAISGCIRDFDGANVSSRSNATKRTCFIHFLICQGAVRLVEILLAPQVDAVHDRGGCLVAHRSGRSNVGQLTWISSARRIEPSTMSRTA